MKNTVKGALIASAVCAMFTSGIAQAAEGKAAKAGGKEVHCAGVNDCKGKGACKGADNTCAGENGCKGKGWTKMSAKDCKEKGGKVVTQK